MSTDENMAQCPKCGDYHPNCDRLGYCPAEVSDYADKIMAEVDGDIKAGLVPATVATFSELHDYVDANDYALEAVPFSGPPCTCVRTTANPGCSCAYAEAWGEYMELLNVVETEVSARLAARTAR
jgi:hypothetical protein